MIMPPVIKNRWVQLGAAAVVSFIGGGGLGYILGKKHEKERNRFKANADITISEVYKSLAQIREDRAERQRQQELEYEAIQAANRRAMAEDEETEQTQAELEAEEEAEEEVEEMVVTVVEDPTKEIETDAPFAPPDGDWDWEKEMTARRREEPYIIHVEEYVGDEMEFHQDTLTYYEGDDVMADSDDTPVYNYAGLMGELKFGHGSHDPNVVYIRNEVIHMEWEVLYNPGYFSREVLGLEMEKDAENEIKHSYSVPKFRRE